MIGEGTKVTDENGKRGTVVRMTKFEHGPQSAVVQWDCGARSNAWPGDLRVVPAPDLKRLRELATKATPGPWWFDVVGDYVWRGEYPRAVAQVADDHAGTLRMRGFGAQLPIDANGEYVAALSPEVVLALIDMAEGKA